MVFHFLGFHVVTVINKVGKQAKNGSHLNNFNKSELIELLSSKQCIVSFWKIDKNYLFILFNQTGCCKIKNNTFNMRKLFLHYT